MPQRQPQITFNRGQGGLGRPLSGKDHYSAMLFYYDTLPAGFASNDRIKQIFSLEEAEDLGIVDDHSDETLGTGGNVAITVKGATDDVETITIEGALLGNYTILSGDADADAVATGLRAAINARTTIHGWTAAGATASVLLTQPAGNGVLNTAGLAFSSSGTGTATLTQITGGAGSYFAIMHYHISEFFRMNQKGVLFVGIYAEKTWDGTEIETMQNDSIVGGDIRQMGVFTSAAAFATGQVTLAQTAVTNLKTVFKPLVILFTSDFSAATITAVSDLSALTAQDIAVVVGEDGAWHVNAWAAAIIYKPGDKVTFQAATYTCIKANTASATIAPWDSVYWVEFLENLPDIEGFSISCMGNALGTVSLAKVNQSIAWVRRFNLVSDNNLDVAGFATGVLFDSISSNAVDTLVDKHYIFIKKHLGKDGTFYVDTWTAIIETNDFATIENNRTMNKAERNIRTSMIDNLNGELFVNKDGTLTDDVIALFTNDSDIPIKQMQTDGEISARSVTINSAQDVLSTSKIIITVVLIPVGVGRQIEFNIGFDVKITTTS